MPPVTIYQMVHPGEDRDWEMYESYCEKWRHSLVRVSRVEDNGWVASMYKCLACKVTRVLFRGTEKWSSKKDGLAGGNK